MSWQEKEDEFTEKWMRCWSSGQAGKEMSPQETDRMRQKAKAAGTRGLGKVEEKNLDSNHYFVLFVCGIKLHILCVNQDAYHCK